MWEKYSSIIPYIAVDPGVINTVASWAAAEGYDKILVVSDPNTRRVAGEFVVTSLKSSGISVYECCYRADEPAPDEFSIGILTAAFIPGTDLILGVGSGTINDICTYVGAKLGCPSAIVGTAPSMDGYASLGSAMLLDGIKVTPPTQCPVAIFCDIDILAKAPVLLTAAGLGDMLGKFTAHADWQLSHILTGEPVPADVLGIVKDALDKVVKGAPYLAGRDPDVIKSVTEGLILSGIAMSLYGDSRPASGTEHHLAHFWEMRMIAEGRKPALHGIKVGLATVAGLVLWKDMLSCLTSSRFKSPVSSECCKPCSGKTHKDEIKRLYGSSAESILQTENPVIPAAEIEKHLRSILDIAEALPSPGDIVAKLAAAGAPVHPSDIDLGEDTLRDSIIYARDRKKTFTILQLLGSMGCLGEFSGRVHRYFTGSVLKGIKCFVLDMDGTIYLGNKIFPYTGRFLDHLGKTGTDFIFYTNNSSQNASFYINKLLCMGIPVTKDTLLMSTRVLLNHLAASGTAYKKVFIAGTDALRNDFEAAGYIFTETEPDFIVLGFDTGIDYARLTKLCDFVRSGLPYYGVHMDYNCPVEGGFIPDCGSLAAAVTASTGITPEFFGKPSRYTLDYIINKTGYREDELCFIGDRLYTDIAIASGTKARSVLVLSGETKRGDLCNSLFIPDLVVEDLEELMTKYL